MTINVGTNGDLRARGMTVKNPVVQTFLGPLLTAMAFHGYSLQGSPSIAQTRPLTR